MLVEQIDPHGHRVLRQRFEGAAPNAAWAVTSAATSSWTTNMRRHRHALLTLLEDGRVSVRDLGTRNGTRVDGNRVPADSGAVIEQGEIIVGRTRLLVRTLHTPIGQERVFRREFVRRNRTILAVVGVAACIAFGGFMQWLDAPSSMLAQHHDGGARGPGTDHVVDRTLGTGDQAESWKLACPHSPDDRLDRRGDLRLGILARPAW